MLMKTLYERLIENGVKSSDMSNCCSDLYVKYTPKNLEFIRNNYEYGKSDAIVSFFDHQVHKIKYIEITF